MLIHCVISVHCLSFLIQFFHLSFYLSFRYNMDGTMAYKIHHSDDWTPYPCSSLRRKSVTTVTPLYASSQKIKELKFRHLQELKKVLPQDFHAFYNGLQHE